jgi:transcriptional regulator with XRE-family HTH domain
MPFDARVFGDRLRSTRKGLGLSQEQVAEALGTAHGWISELETGRRPQVQAQTLYRLCEILHVSADYLLGLQDTAAGVTTTPPPPAKRPRPRKATSVG